MQGTLVGYLGKNPETRESQNGSFTIFTVAENIYNPETGERDITVWYSVIMNGRRGEVVANHFSKGDGIIVHGESQGIWQGDNGNANINFRATSFTFPPSTTASDTGNTPQVMPGDDPFA